MYLREKAFYSNMAHIAVFASFAIAPIFDLLAGYPTFFVANRNSPLDIIELSLVVGIGVPVVIALIDLSFFLVNKRLGSLVHYVLFALLGVVIVLPILKKTSITSDTIIIIISVAISLLVLLCYLRLTLFRTILTYCLPIILLFPGFFLFFSPVTEVVFPNKHAVSYTTTIKSNIPIVMITFDEASTTHLMNDNREISEYSTA